MKIGSDWEGIPLKNPNPVDEISHSYFPTEKKWQAHVEKTFKDQGWLCYHTWDSRRSEAGFPDLELILPGVAHIHAELKNEKGELTFAQEHWLLAIAWTGGSAYLWRPSDAREIYDIIENCHALSLNFGRRLTRNVGGGRI